MRIALVVVTSFVASFTSGSEAAAQCTKKATSIVLSPRDIAVPASGGVVVGSTSIGIGSASGAANAINPSWRFHDETGAEFEPTLVTLAPGLVSYRPTGTPAGKLRLAKDTLELHTIVKATAEPAELEAPSVTKVKARGAQVTVELAAGAPEDALAIVVLAVGKKGNVARSWGSVSKDETEVVVYQKPGRCEAPIPGVKPSKSGERVVVAFVDKLGRLSKLSTPLKVTAR